MTFSTRDQWALANCSTSSPASSWHDLTGHPRNSPYPCTSPSLCSNYFLDPECLFPQMLARRPLVHSVDLSPSLASRSLFTVAHKALWDVAHGPLALLFPVQQSHWPPLSSWNTPILSCLRTLCAPFPMASGFQTSMFQTHYPGRPSCHSTTLALQPASFMASVRTCICITYFLGH